jgi:hypothetical protein
VSHNSNGASLRLHSSHFRYWMANLLMPDGKGRQQQGA